MKSNKLGVFVCLSCGVLIFAFVFLTSDAKTLAHNLSLLRLPWIAAAVAGMLAYFFLETAALHTTLVTMHPAQKLRDTFHVTMGGHYFNNITPFASGGQPFQAYYLTRGGVPLGIAASGLLARFIVYQAALVVCSVLLLILRLPYFQATVSNFSSIVLFGFFINLAVMAALIAVAFFRNGVRRFADAVVHFLAGHRLFVKDEAAAVAYIDAELAKFADCFADMAKNGRAIARSFVFSVAQLIAYFFVPYAVYRSFGLSEVDFITVAAAQAFVMMVSAFIPIPGASIGAEGFFLFFFGKFFADSAQTGVAMILWRVITFYLTLLLGAFFAMKAGKKTEPGESA